MIGLIKNEWVKFIHNKKLYGFVLLVFLIHMLPVFMTLMINMRTENGQSFPLTMFGVITSFAMPVFLIILAAEIFSEELLSGNMALSLVHPVTRTQVLAAKVIFMLFAILGLQLLSLFLGYLIGTVIFGWGTDFMLRGSAYTMMEGIFITVTAYMSAALPLWVFTILIMFISFIIQGGAAVVGISAGLYMFMVMLDLLSDQLRPFLITNYFNTIPLLLEYMNNPNSLTFALYFLGAITMVFFVLTLIIFKRRDMVN